MQFSQECNIVFMIHIFPFIIYIILSYEGSFSAPLLAVALLQHLSLDFLDKNIQLDYTCLPVLGID